MTEPSPARRDDACPLCGGPNGCGLAAGSRDCWCFSARIPASVLDRLPPEARNASCICQTCARASVPGPTAREAAER